MPTLGRYIQTPGSNELYEIDYSDWLDTDNAEVLSNLSAVWSPTYVGPPAFDVAPVYLSGDTLSGLFNVSGGEANGVYMITLTATSNSGRIREDCVEISVETPCNG
jgi:hypothetical protein